MQFTLTKKEEEKTQTFYAPPLTPFFSKTILELEHVCTHLSAAQAHVLCWFMILDWSEPLGSVPKTSSLMEQTVSNLFFFFSDKDTNI